RYRGGHCCSGRTEEIFSDAEVASLRLSGTTAGRLSPPPPSDHAGCAFRGPSGCSLEPEDRPSLCVGYICQELKAELQRLDNGPKIKALAAELRSTFERFSRR